jgi:hypothetical protein
MGTTVTSGTFPVAVIFGIVGKGYPNPTCETTKTTQTTQLQGGCATEIPQPAGLAG